MINSAFRRFLAISIMECKSFILQLPATKFVLSRLLLTVRFINDAEHKTACLCWFLFIVIVSHEHLTLAAQVETAIASPRDSSEQATESAPDTANSTAPSNTASTVTSIHPEWNPGDPKTALSGLIPAPADIPGLGRWQAMMKPIGSYVESAVFSPDGEQVAFGDGTYVRIHESESLDLIRVLVGHTANVRAVGWSPDGQLIASSGDDATVRIWTTDGVPVHTLHGHSAPVRDIAWHPQSQSLVTASVDSTIRLWNIDGTAGLVIGGHKAPVNTVAWSSDGQLLAAGDDEQTVRVWNADGSPGPVLLGHKGPISRVKWSPDDEWLASSSLGLAPSEPGQEPDATIRLWKKDGTVGPTLRGHGRDIRALAWNPDSRELVSAGEDRKILLWSVEGKLLRQVENLNFIDSCMFSLDWNAKAERILAGGRFSVRFFDLAGPIGSTSLIRPMGGKLNHLDWSPVSDKIAITSDDSTVYIWSGDLRQQLTLNTGRDFAARVDWSNDGQQLAVVDGSTNVRIVNPGGKTILELPGVGGHPTGLSWSPDGQRLAVAKRFGESAIFEMSGKAVSIAFHERGLGGVSMSPDGKLLATAGLDAKVRISRIVNVTEPPEEVAILEAHDGDVDSIQWSPDGKWLATGHNTSLRLWLPDGTPGRVIQAADAAIMQIDWNPDSQQIVTGSWDTAVCLWNPKGELIREFPSHAAPCVGVSFSPNGEKLATCGWDGVARVLDVKTGQILAMAIQVADPILNGPRYPIHHAISFNRAGQVTSGDLEILEQQFVYLVEEPSGAFSVLQPSEFQAKAPGATLADQ